MTEFTSNLPKYMPLQKPQGVGMPASRPQNSKLQGAVPSKEMKQFGAAVRQAKVERAAGLNPKIAAPRSVRALSDKLPKKVSRPALRSNFYQPK